jgi:pyruvate formate lyase activating enzyme
MRIGGFQKFSLIDYPGKVAAVVFTQGCNFRCGYCHNPQLVLPERYCPAVNEEEILTFLRRRSNRLQGVVVTGGEPTIHGDLDAFLKRLKDLEYSVKLDTNGSRPDVVRSLLERNLVDYIAMDVKAPPEKYREVIGVRMSVALMEECIRVIKASGINHHFRTTVLRQISSVEDRVRILELTEGSRHVWQSFVPQPNMIDPTLMEAGVVTEMDVLTPLNADV